MPQAKKQARRNTFDRAMTEAVNESLNNLFGKPAAKALLYHLEKNNIKMEEISENPTKFAAALEKIFGEGARLIETTIVKALYSKLGMEYQMIKDYGFADYVKHAKEKHRST